MAIREMDLVKVWENGELVDDKIMYHFRGLHKEQ